VPPTRERFANSPCTFRLGHRELQMATLRFEDKSGNDSTMFQLEDGLQNSIYVLYNPCPKAEHCIIFILRFGSESQDAKISILRFGFESQNANIAIVRLASFHKMPKAQLFASVSNRKDPITPFCDSRTNRKIGSTCFRLRCCTRKLYYFRFAISFRIAKC
jgi:hypothetical protein